MFTTVPLQRYNTDDPRMTCPPLAIFWTTLDVFMKASAENSAQLYALAGSQSRRPWEKLAYAGLHAGHLCVCVVCKL